ncbi:chorismate mutase [Paracoccus endophyticus]|uniref:chorismate mutase n=1 Tax=Paracoccus endophyticus TaxID=2233774 RepID=UPI000DDA7CC2|nr:chorismate mutase [Paracoccus endophyticus]
MTSPLTPDDIAALTDMTALRAAIDALDRRLVDLLADRSRLIDRAAQIKAQAGLPARIGWRVEEVAANARANAVRAGLDPDLAEALWRRMMEHFIAQEARALGERDDG